MGQFYKYAQNHFTFLQRYGYVCSHMDDENRVNFVGKNNQIDISFSTIGYELTCQFIDDAKNTFTLQEALDFVEIKGFKGEYQIASKEDMEDGIVYLAGVVKRLFDKIDISDILNFQKIVQYRLGVQKKLLEDYYFKIDMEEAEECWKKGDFSNAQKLYEKHISRLSKTQIKKLDYIIKHR